jgi:hypothetical protein
VLIKLNDYTRYIFCSNAACPLHIDLADRRYFVLDVCDKKCNDKEYFVDLKAKMNKISAEIFFNHLIHRDISKFNPRKYPETKAKQEMKLESLPVVMKWLINVCQTYQHNEFCHSTEESYHMFTDYCGNNGFRSPSSTIFARELTSYIPTIKRRNGHKTLAFRVINIINLRGLIRSKLGPDVDLGDDNE